MLLPSWSILKAKELTPSERHLLHVVKLHIGNNASATVGQECLAEDTGLSRATVNKLIMSLEQKEWITITKRRHRSNGYVVHEYRLVSETFKRTFQPKLTPSVKSDDKALYNDYTRASKDSLHKDTITKIKETKIENQDKVFAGKPATTSEPLKIQEPVGEDIDINAYPIETSKLANVPELQKIWKARIAESYPDQEFVADLTAKERGQLKDFIKRLGDNDPTKVFDTVISNWHEFTRYVSDSDSALPWKNMSDMPSIPFMLTHVSCAGNFPAYLENKTARAKANHEAIEKKHKQFELERAATKAAKEAAILMAQANMSEEDKNIEKYRFQYDKICTHERVMIVDDPISPDYDISEEDSEKILEERCKKTFAKLLAEGSLLLTGWGVISLDSPKLMKYSG